MHHGVKDNVTAAEAGGAAGDTPGLLPEPATGDGRRFVRHLFVCTSDTACARDGPAHAIRDLLKQSKVEAGLKESVRVNKAGCLGQCGHGPMMVVYPEGVWYAHLDLEGAARVWQEHVLHGRPVEALRYVTPEPGTNVVPFRSVDQREPDRASPWYAPCRRCPPGGAR